MRKRLRQRRNRWAALQPRCLAMKALGWRKRKSPSHRSRLQRTRGLSQLDLEREADIREFLRRHLDFQCGVLLLPVDFALVAENLDLEDLAGLLRTGEPESLHYGLFLRPALDKGINS